MNTPPSDPADTPPETLDIEIRGIAVGGAAVGRVTGPEASPRIGMAAFVPLAAPGETVRAQVTRAWSRHLEAELTEIVTASPHRVTPRCAHFGACGGCHFQHLGGDFQRAARRQMVVDALRTGGLTDLTDRVDDTVPGPEYAYRQRIVLHVADDGRVGFYRRRSHTLLTVDACPVATPAIERFLSEGLVLGALPGEGLLTVEEGDNGLFGILRLDADADPATVGALTARLAARFVGGEVRCAGRPASRFGESAVERTVNGVPARTAPGGFAQANAAVNDQLIRAVCAAAAGCRARSACDLYAGSGNFAFPLAAAGIPTVAVESDPMLAAAGRAETARRELPVRFVEDRVEHHVRQRPAFTDLIVADPPRAGLDKVARHLGFGTHLLLISCHLPAAVRDLKALRDAGWRAERITPFDMFPQTAHVEILTRLVRA